MSSARPARRAGSSTALLIPIMAAASRVCTASVDRPRVTLIRAAERYGSAAPMRHAVLALIACSIFCVARAPPAAAGDLPYCIKGCDFGGGTGDCSFSSYQQCLAAASGRDATCAANPYFNAKGEVLAQRGLSRKRKY